MSSILKKYNNVYIFVNMAAFNSVDELFQYLVDEFIQKPASTEDKCLLQNETISSLVEHQHYDLLLYWLRNG